MKMHHMLVQSDIHVPPSQTGNVFHQGGRGWSPASWVLQPVASFNQTSAQTANMVALLMLKLQSLLSVFIMSLLLLLV